MAKEITKKKSTNVGVKSSTKKTTTKSTNNTKRKKGNKKFNINKKLIFGLLSVFIIIGVISLSFILTQKENVVITIDDVEYTESDFNMYAYLIKYEYFGIDGTDLNESILNTQVSNDSEQTIGEYLKEKTISKIKVSSAILKIANENNITLKKSDYKEIEKEKNVFIEALGGKSSYNEMLKKNSTNDEAYMEVAEINKLYDLIYESIYDEGKRNDLTQEELLNYTESYKSDYVKIKQIVLLKKDLETNKFLDETTLNQKEILAKELVRQAKDGADFNSLIKKYSEGYDENYTSEYYLKTELIEELRTSIEKLAVGDISGVISSEYAYHIVIREELDNEKLDTYLDSKREEKLIQDIADNLEKIAIINSDYLEEITVK